MGPELLPDRGEKECPSSGEFCQWYKTA
jgi:hypothetical protein